MTNSNLKSSPLSLQDKFIQDLMTQQAPVAIYLLSGIKLQGYIIGHDKYTLLLSGKTENGNSNQLIYKHTISTILLAFYNRTNKDLNSSRRE